MYATDSVSGVYHLLSDTQDRTLCGQGVAPVIINRPAKTATLHLTEIKPADRKLCRECGERRAAKDSDR